MVPTIHRFIDLQMRNAETTIKIIDLQICRSAGEPCPASVNRKNHRFIDLQMRNAGTTIKTIDLQICRSVRASRVPKSCKGGDSYSDSQAFPYMQIIKPFPIDYQAVPFRLPSLSLKITKPFAIDYQTLPYIQITKPFPYRLPSLSRQISKPFPIDYQAFPYIQITEPFPIDYQAFPCRLASLSLQITKPFPMDY